MATHTASTVHGDQPVRLSLRQAGVSLVVPLPGPGPGRCRAWLVGRLVVRLLGGVEGPAQGRVPVPLEQPLQVRLAPRLANGVVGAGLMRLLRPITLVRPIALVDSPGSLLHLCDGDRLGGLVDRFSRHLRQLTVVRAAEPGEVGVDVLVGMS